MKLSIAEHMKANRGAEFLETDYGWALYWRCGKDAIYIEDICIYPGSRNQGYALELAAKVEKLAHEEGCQWLYTNVHPVVTGARRMHDLILKFGFEVYLDSDIITIYRKRLPLLEAI